MNPFHLAIPVDDLALARHFYTEVLGCNTGRESERWIDFDFWGHQLVVHLVDSSEAAVPVNPVDGELVPARHFGVVLAWEEFEPLLVRLRQYGVDFLIEPQLRFAGLAGEQRTMFLRDPGGNALEFKCFRDPAELFRK